MLAKAITGAVGGLGPDLYSKSSLATILDMLIEKTNNLLWSICEEEHKPSDPSNLYVVS